MTAMTQICKVPVKCKWEKIRVKVKGIKVKARYRCAGSDLCLCVSFIVLLIREEFFLFLVRIAMRYEVFKRRTSLSFLPFVQDSAPATFYQPIRLLYLSSNPIRDEQPAHCRQ